MRMILPPQRERRAILRSLEEYFETHRVAAFNEAVRRICQFYRLKRPKVEWFEYIDWGKVAGKTYEDGKIHLVHPENWKNGRKYNSRKQWIDAVFHEFGHFVFWADAERKADLFARRMVQGIAPGNVSGTRAVRRGRATHGRVRSRNATAHGRERRSG